MSNTPAALDIRTLADRARAVLDDNRVHGTTAPAIGADWYRSTWDSAFVALGLRHVDPQRAAAELRSSFDGQWSNGLLPHLTFAPASEETPAGGSYRTNPDFWNSSASAAAPADIATSGVGSPPIQATVALLIADMLGADGHQFLAELYPRLVAWHAYLLTTRTRHDIPIAEVWHPWETARANSPAWDEPLRFVDASGAQALRAASPVEIAPSWFDDRSLRLVDAMRRNAYPTEATDA